MLELGTSKQTAAVAFTCALWLGCARSAEPPLTASELAKPWSLLYVPAVSGTERVIHTPHGYFALSRESVGGGKTLMGVNSYLYQSNDGVRWRLKHLERLDAAFGLRGIAYGAGRFVMVGSGFGTSEIWSSAQATSWKKASFAIEPAQLAGAVFVNERFFALSTDGVQFTSTDGENWTELRLPVLQPNGVAFGNGRYVLVGSGPILSSVDGLRWQAHAPDCRLPGACISDPSGNVRAGSFSEATFADGFYVNQLFSPDGTVWQAHSQPIAEIYVGGYLLGRATERSRWGLPPDPGERDELLAWKPGAPPIRIEVRRQSPPAASAAALAMGQPLPSAIDSPLPGGETCLTRRCIVIDQSIYLVP